MKFPDASCRDQQSTSACHSFAAVALLEAALKRRYGGAGLTRLSEADLFVRRALADPRYFKEVTRHLKSGKDLRGAFFDAGGGNSYDDASSALRTGVAPEGAAPWAEFYRRYLAYKEAVLAAVKNELRTRELDPELNPKSEVDDAARRTGE